MSKQASPTYKVNECGDSIPKLAQTFSTACEKFAQAEVAWNIDAASLPIGYGRVSSPSSVDCTASTVPSSSPTICGQRKQARSTRQRWIS